MAVKNPKEVRRRKLRYRIRKKVSGTAEVPRLAVYKSNRAIYAQVIDDEKGHTIVATDSRKYDSRGCEAAKRVGEDVVNRLRNSQITKVVYDRSGYAYHGRVKALFGVVQTAFKL